MMTPSQILVMATERERWQPVDKNQKRTGPYHAFTDGETVVTVQRRVSSDANLGWYAGDPEDRVDPWERYSTSGGACYAEKRLDPPQSAAGYGLPPGGRLF